MYIVTLSDHKAGKVFDKEFTSEYFFNKFLKKIYKSKKLTLIQWKKTF